MKKLTKATALILSAIMLFGCADGTQSNAGSTTQPSESSATESKTDNSETGSNTSNSDTSEDTRNYNLVQSKEGYQTFSFDPNKHIVINMEEYVASFTGVYYGSDVGYEGYAPLDPTPENLKKLYGSSFEPIAIKCHVAGDSYVFKHGKCGEVQVMKVTIGSGFYTPVVVEEIIDTYDYECVFKEGDIIYVNDYYNISDPYDEESLKNFQQRLEELKSFESRYFDQIEEITAFTKKLDYFDLLLNGNGKYIESTWAPVIIQKGQSYLIFVDNDNTPNEVDGNVYNRSFPLAFDLERDEPTVYRNKDIDETIFYCGLCYPHQWKYLKEKYGKHFNN